MSSLPEGWQKKTLGETCNILAGFGFPERLQGKTSGDIPFFKVGDISTAWKGGSTYLTTANHYLSTAEAKEIRARPLPKNTTVFAKIGAAIALNRRAMLSDSALVDNNVMGLHPLDGNLDPKYLFHFVCTVKLDELSRATTVPSVRKSDVEQIVIPIPSPDEQRRIVAEIEQQLTRLNVGATALRQVQAKLKRYRATVLKAACEGRLVPTEAELARQEGRPYEPASELLVRILTERRKNWAGHGRYQEPAAASSIDDLSLPEGWVWARVEQLGEVQLGRQRSPRNISKDFPTPYLRAANITEHGLDLSDVLEMEFSPAERGRFAMQNGDLVLSEASGSVSQVGKPAVWRNQLPLCCFQNTVIRLRPTLPMSAYALTAFHHCYTNGIFARVAGGVGINHLSADKFSRVLFPLPPLAEQARIVAEVERRLSVVDELEAAVAANLKRAARLRQSILQRAFSGKLLRSIKG